MESIKGLLETKRNIILKGADPLTRKGFVQVPKAILTHPNLSIHAKMVYTMLLYYAWEKDFCFPGQDKLAEDMGSGVRSIVRAIKNLQKYKVLEIKRRGQGKTNIYTLWIKVRK